MAESWSGGRFGGRVCCRGCWGCHRVGSLFAAGQSQENSLHTFSLMSADLLDVASDGVTCLMWMIHSVDEDCKSLLSASVSPSAPGENYPLPALPILSAHQ